MIENKKDRMDLGASGRTRAASWLLALSLPVMGCSAAQAPSAAGQLAAPAAPATSTANAATVALPLATSGDSAPEVPGFQPGEYVTEAGWGRLLVTQGPDKRQSFAIQSITGEDFCDLKGEMSNGKGVARDDTASCSVSFAGKAGAIDISASTPEECKRFCGQSGGFEGTYLKVAKGCGQDDIAQTRRTFKRLYQQKLYQPALSELSPVIENCSSTLAWEEEGDIRNDLAIAQYKNGLHAQCLATLAKYADDAKLDDGEVADTWPPALADRYKTIVRAARTNIGLCSRSARK